MKKRLCCLLLVLLVSTCTLSGCWEEPLPEEGDGLPPLPSAESEAIDRDGQLSLLRRIHALPEPGREVVYLRVFGSLSFREIGEVLGRTETWARVTFYRCKEHLKTGGEYHEK